MRAFVGFGDLGQQVEALLSEAGGAAERVCFDDPMYESNHPKAQPFANYGNDAFADFEFYVCIGYRHLKTKRRVIHELTERSRRLPAFVHSSSHVSGTANIGAGSIVYPMSCLDKDVSIGKGVLVNNSVTICHNGTIGDCSYVSPGAVVCGYVSIGAETFIGAGAVVSDGVTIGDNVTIGIGTVVTADVPSGASVIGNPMRILDRRLEL